MRHASVAAGESAAQVAELGARRAAALEDQLAEKRRLMRGTEGRTRRRSAGEGADEGGREDEKDAYLCGIEAAGMRSRPPARGAPAEATEARTTRGGGGGARRGGEARADALGENRGQDLDRVEALKDAYRIVEVKLRVARRDAGAGGYLVSRGAADVFAMR